MRGPENLPDPIEALRSGEALLIVPPFVHLSMPSLAAHLLQAHAREAGIEVRVLYANLHLAAVVGFDRYRTLCLDLPDVPLVGERLFAAKAFGGHRRPSLAPSEEPAPPRRLPARESAIAGGAELEEIRSLVDDWVDGIAASIVARGYRVVGCTCSFEQICPSIALLDAVKRAQPGVLAILGGANCEGEMADGLADLGTSIDHFFSGESDETLVPFLRRAIDGRPPSERIIRGRPVRDLDIQPRPDFREFFEQLGLLHPDRDPGTRTWVPYESSRGCWWGEKHHCTFCGLNGEEMGFRQKSPETVLRDLETIAATSPTRRVFMVDNIMPRQYLKSVLLRLAEAELGLRIFYEQKANLSLEDVGVLQAAGVLEIQPGIEALSTPLLRLMNKGLRAEQNIALLRHARSLSVAILWNLLFGFPGDRKEWYLETSELLPLLRHLHPPKGLFRMSIDRFSPYFTDPERHEISRIRPLRGYADVFPEGADLDKLAYHFDADFPSGSLEAPGTIETLRGEVALWRDAWFSAGSCGLPELSVRRLTDRSYLLRDTRGLPGTREHRLVGRSHAAVALLGSGEAAAPEAVDVLEWKAAALLDGRAIALATADPDLVESLAEERRVRGPGG